jgi:soluble lytic murein transglycosylase-like protein
MKTPTERVLVVGFVVLAIALGWQTARHQAMERRADVFEKGLIRVEGVNEFQRLQLERYTTITSYADRYNARWDMAELVYEVALVEELPLDLAFRLVDVESDFKPRAVSHAHAIGLAQVMLSTARTLQSGITLEQLFDPETNLRLGFRYLNILLEEYDGDLRLALLAYNRGPSRVDGLLAMGQDPANGYANSVCRGPCEGVID